MAKFNKRSLAKNLTFTLVLLFVIPLLILSQNVKADSSINLTLIGSTESTLTFSWTAINDSSFTKYALYESMFDLHTDENSNGPYNEIWNTTTEGATTTTIITTNIARLSDKDSITHYFYILESNSLGNSTKSNIIAVSPTAPPNPNLYIASRTTNTVTIQWADYNNYCPQAPFNSYSVQVNTGENGTWSTIQTITDSSIHSYTITGLNASQYQIRIYDTIDVAGNIQTSYSNIAVTPIDSDTSRTPSNSILTPIPTSSAPEFPTLAILPIFLGILFAAIILRHRKTANSNLVKKV